MPEKIVQVGRLALRHEGAFWNAYYAMPNTMDGAILIGSIAIQFVANNQARKDAFIGLMREAVGELLYEQTGQQPSWTDGPRPAPQHERAGHS